MDNQQRIYNLHNLTAYYVHQQLTLNCVTVMSTAGNHLQRKKVSTGQGRGRTSTISHEEVPAEFKQKQKLRTYMQSILGFTVATVVSTDSDTRPRTSQHVKFCNHRQNNS